MSSKEAIRQTKQKIYYQKNKKKIIANKQLYAEARVKNEPKYREYLNLLVQKSKTKKNIKKALERLDYVQELKMNKKLDSIELKLDQIRKELHIEKKTNDV